MDNRPYYSKPKYNYSGSDVCDTDDEDDAELHSTDSSFPTDPDLLLLRKAAQEERAAITLYLRAASKTSEPVCRLFLDTARDKMLHFRRTMALLAKYDPIQAQAFQNLGINLALGDVRKNHSASHCSEERLETIDLLSLAIISELAAINMYQESYEQACHDDVETLFANNANESKLHLAEFWKALMVYTKEGIIRP
jgi:rubrerythrin